MSRQINPNLIHLNTQEGLGMRGSILEGSSRSGKTWSAIEFILKLCARDEQSCTINIVKETNESFKTTLYDDFNRIFPRYNFPSPFEGMKEVRTFFLFGNRINLLGADKPSKFHGASCDYFYINEGLDIDQDIFDQLEQRCRKFWFIDYNPKLSDHWIFDRVIPRNNVSFLKTTFLDNPYISKPEYDKILSYENTPYNQSQGTVDEYKWKVYGLGERCAPEGLVFPYVTWINSFPQAVERVFYGLDFGYTNDPTAIVKVGVNGRNIYLKKLFYYPVDNADLLTKVINRLIPMDSIIWADSADPGMIGDLQRNGLTVIGAKKFPGCIMHRIDIIKRYKIHIVRDIDFRKEQENYKFKEVQGIRLNEPIDKYNHLWDATGYACQHELRPL